MSSEISKETKLRTLFKKAYLLLTVRERRNFFVLMGLVMVSSLFQTIGIGAILPFLLLLLNPGKLEGVASIDKAREWVGFESSTDFVTLMGVVAILLFLLGLVFKFLTEYFLIRYANGRRYRFSLLILEEKLNMSYEEYIQTNSAEAIAQITNHVNIFVESFCLPFLKVLCDCVLLIFVIALLMATSPIVTLFLGVFIGGGYFLFHLLTAKKLKRTGATIREASIRQVGIVNESMAGFKEVKVLGRMEDFLRQYKLISGQYFRSYLQYRTLQLCPPFVLQAVVILVLFAVILFFIRRGDDAGGVVALLGFFGVAAKQLMPALSTVFSSIQGMQHSSAVASDMIETLSRLHERKKPVSEEQAAECNSILEFEKKIAVRNLSFRYAGTSKDVLTDINVEIPKNSSIALVGSTGSGKTTFADVLIGLLKSTAGSIEVDGQILTEAMLERWQRMISYVPQSIFLGDTSVRQNIALGLNPVDVDEDFVHRAARTAQIHDFIVKELPQGYDTIVGERGVRLSGGQRQRLGIARALYHQPKIIVLDEATSALDNRTERDLTRAIDALGRDHTLIIIAHRLTTIEKCDQIVVLSGGRIQSKGTYEYLKSDCAEFKKLVI